MEPNKIRRKLYVQIVLEIRREVQIRGGFDEDLKNAKSYQILMKLLQSREKPPWSLRKVAKFEEIYGSGTYQILLQRVEMERYRRYMGKKEKGLPVVQSQRVPIGIKQNMAEYWWGGHHDSVLFCKTSEGLLLHLPEAHFLEAIREGKSVILKKWPSIQNGTKRKRSTGKGKEKTSTVVVLPAPTTSVKRQKLTPELPVEVLLQIIQSFSEPTPDMRRIIFKLVKPGTKSNWVTEELAMPKLVWRWYQQTLQTEPPRRLAHLWKYYVVNKQDSATFVREWYSGFVRAYDMKQLDELYYSAEGDYLSQSLSEIMRKGPILHIIMNQLRGRTIGSGHLDETVVLDYQIIEVEISKAFDTIPATQHFERVEIIDTAMTNAMLNYGESRYEEVFVEDYLNILAIGASDVGFDDGPLESVAEFEWMESHTRTWFELVLRPIQALSELAVRIIRGLGKTQSLSAKDYTAVVWLNFVTMNLDRDDDLATAMRVGIGRSPDFIADFIGTLRIEVQKIRQPMKGSREVLATLKEQRARDEQAWILKGKPKEDEEEEEMSSSTTTITGRIGEGSTMRAVVTVDGSFVAAKMIGIRQDALFRLAKIHVQKNGLNWHITKPRSWTFNAKNPMGPHISLRKNMRVFKGDTLEVEILNISHFEDPPSRWVVMNVKLPKKFKCLYECHLSIGQQRISTSQFWN